MMEVWRRKSEYRNSGQLIVHGSPLENITIKQCNNPHPLERVKFVLLWSVG